MSNKNKNKNKNGKNNNRINNLRDDSGSKAEDVVMTEKADKESKKSKLQFFPSLPKKDKVLDAKNKFSFIGFLKFVLLCLVTFAILALAVVFVMSLVGPIGIYIARLANITNESSPVVLCLYTLQVGMLLFFIAAPVKWLCGRLVNKMLFVRAKGLIPKRNSESEAEEDGSVIEKN